MKYILTILLLLAFVPSQAKYTQTCHIRYKLKDGWSDEYYVDVKFVSGKELNEATKTYNYHDYEVYGVIFWGEDKVTVIDTDVHFSKSDPVMRADIIEWRTTDIDGEDQNGKKWQICVLSNCW